MFFRTEPSTLTVPAATGILLCNLGTPATPTPSAMRRYLREFLTDPRVVEMPRWLWWPILHGYILRRRPAQSAARYHAIWMPEGSPLLVWSERQAALLRQALGTRGHATQVEEQTPVHLRVAMRYGAPSIASRLDELKALGCTRILIVPLYPQYAGSTTAAVTDAVACWMRRVRRVPELRFIGDFHDDAGYIDALAARVRQAWQTDGPPNKLVLSFHGLPERMGEQGDPYPAQCRATARLLAARLGLPDDRWIVTFQSRFGNARWLQPATQAVLEQLGSQKTGRLDVLCPGFVADCLETLEEIAQENRATFLNAGGGAFRYIPCLNDDPAWISALADLVRRHLQGWPAGCSVDI
ncbi:MAG: ferrochelatase [Burkholderiaceae bacterium]|jgi:ferrochelatase|nr:ferrochelatase [Burkholderiaceae bacterium]